MPSIALVCLMFLHHQTMVRAVVLLVQVLYQKLSNTLSSVTCRHACIVTGPGC